MHDIEMKVEELCKMRKTLSSWMNEEIDKGKECVNTEEAGDVVDMIKDLAEAEEKIWKACYYKQIVKAMHEAEEKEKGMPWYMSMLRSGYDHWRYPSSGRFASTGHGERYGWHDPMMYGSIDDFEAMRYGYDDTRERQHEARRGTGMMGYNDYMGSPRYGESYDRYENAKRNYTSSHSAKDKETMDMHASEHIKDSMNTMRDIWKDADPNLRKKMKADLTTLVNEMAI